MGITTGIEWTDATWNPHVGCRKVSTGCKNCYMFSEQKRYGNDPNVVRMTGQSTFDAPLRWKEPKKIFTCSWSDFFIEEADEWRAAAWDVIRRTPHHTYQILTKRPERIQSTLPGDWGDGWPNVWLGTSVENQAAADERIPHLLSIPAIVRFLSCEPLLGSVDLGTAKALPIYQCADTVTYVDGLSQRVIGVANRQHSVNGGWRRHDGFRTVPGDYNWINWVIAGGESGAGARPCHPDWARSLRDQCVAAGVSFFWKQWGEYLGGDIVNDDAYSGGGYLDCRSNGYATTVNLSGYRVEKDVNGNPLPCIRVGKKAAGRLLDGRTWDEMPEVAI